MNTDQVLRLEAAKMATSHCTTHGGSIPSVARGIYDFLSEEVDSADGFDAPDFEVPPDVQEIFDKAKKRAAEFNGLFENLIRSIVNPDPGKGTST